MEQERDEFSSLLPAVPPPDLFGKVMARIEIEKSIKSSKKKTIYFLIALLASASAFFAGAAALNGAMAESRIASILSLMVSDPQVVIANWHEFGLFLLESFPGAYAAFSLAALFAFLWSLQYVVRYASKTFSLSKPVTGHQIN